MKHFVTFVIPTVVSKREWLRRTLWGLSKQERIDDCKVLILVDRKPWDTEEALDDEMQAMLPKIEVRSINPPYKFKRQHALVNEAIASMESSELICVMDDDYWCMKRDGVRKMLDVWSPEMIVVPGRYGSSDGVVAPSQQPKVEGNELRYPELRAPVFREYASGLFGMHPFCGNPKIMTAQIWNSVGGFPKGYRHYWFADTELYLRARQRIIESECSFVHAEHERSFPEMFARHNAQLFMDRIGNGLPASDPFRKMAEQLL